MDTTPYAETLRAELLAAAENGEPGMSEAARRLIAGMNAAVRLTLMEALSDAAAEITLALPEGLSVDLRLQGREPSFVVTGQAGTTNPPAGLEAEPEEDDGAVARITFRLPETLKSRAEVLATRNGQSLNTWLVNAARSAAAQSEHTEPRANREEPRPERRLRGWVK